MYNTNSVFYYFLIKYKIYKNGITKNGITKCNKK